jgi:nucleoid DNA-binding protein
MDKPVTLSVKNFLIRKVALDMMIPEKTVEAVVKHEYEQALKAIIKDRSVELSGFGRFYFNKKKANKMMEKYLSQQQKFEEMMNDETLPVHKRKGAEARLATARNNIKWLSPKLNEND